MIRETTLKNDSTQLKSMIDRDLASLAKNKNPQATHELYFRYKPFVHKHWSKLKQNFEKINNRTVLKNLQSYRDDFESESYEAFMKALDYLNVDKIENDKWKFLGVYGYYMNNLRRSFRRQALKKNKEITTDVMINSEETHNLLDNEKYAVPSAEDQFFKMSADERALYFEKNLDEFLTQKEMDYVYLKRNGNSQSEIRLIMSITPVQMKEIDLSIKTKIHEFMESDF